MLNKLLCTAVAATVCLCFATSASSQQLDPQQKEVWKAIKAVSDAWKAGKIREVEKYYHGDFTGWYPEDPFPTRKWQDMVWARHIKATRNIKFIFNHPMRIIIKGNVAIAQYYSAGMSTAKKDKKEKYSTIQWTDVWIKEVGRWKILATHGTRVKL
jgi:ketosteroid isomerase-like protein